MSTFEEERDLVSRGQTYVALKLRENCHKDHWLETDICNLVHGLNGEVQELKDAIVSKQSVDEVWREAADIAAFAFMIAESYEVKGA